MLYLVILLAIILNIFAFVVILSKINSMYISISDRFFQLGMQMNCLRDFIKEIQVKQTVHLNTLQDFIRKENKEEEDDDWWKDGRKPPWSRED